MEFRSWLRPPRQVFVVFLAVALVSASALGWLSWLLLKQERALEVQARQDRLEAAADRTVAEMQRALADLQVNVPSNASAVSIPTGDATTAGNRFAEGERLEFNAGDVSAAVRVYARLAESGETFVRAGALARLARVQRKLGDTAAALRAYAALAAAKETPVDGLPSAIVARTGRASVFEAAHQTTELRAEAAALERELASGALALRRSEYEFYAAQAAAWLGRAPALDRDLLTRAEAVDWLWMNRASLPQRQQRLLTLESGPALVAWQVFPDRVSAVIVGPALLTALCNQTADVRCALSDFEGRVVIGDRPPARMFAVRTAVTAGLPWTVHISSPPAATPSPSRRRWLLVLSFAVVGIVLAAGWYFILRSISREARVARLQSDFVAAVSHEFRSPLTSLAHVADLLANNRLANDDQRRRSYDVLLRETDRLRRLVEGLLEFGRFEGGGATVHLERVNLTALVRLTVADFQERAKADEYAIELTVPAEEVYARADREALTRALWNLLDNAVKYSPDCRTIWVEMSCDAERIEIAVRDRGLGIPAHEQREIFNRFVRGADSKARKIKGTGIGLAMVREIVRAHGGDVRLTSEPGRGSEFTLVLRPTGGTA